MPSASQDADVDMGDASSPAPNANTGSTESGPQDRFMRDISPRLRVVRLLFVSHPMTSSALLRDSVSL